jgi:hypothetical protein
MRITIISHDNWGYNHHIVTALEKRGHIVNHIDFNTFKYQYPNFSYRIYNFFLKAFVKKNIKNIHFGDEIIRRLKALGEIQDVILTIKGDFIDPQKILDFKKYTKKSIGYFNDNIYRCPKIVPTLGNFDEVYSFEKDDVDKYRLNFITNYIYTEAEINRSGNFKYEVFNISSKDNRFKTISKIADILKANDISSKIIVYDKKNKHKSKNIEFISKYIQIQEVEQYIHQSKILLDIHRAEQNGLSFRVFESIGLQKKLITTNHNIVDYIFYNPNNILVIDEKNPVIPKSFFETDYEKIPDEIYDKYTLENWIDIVLLNKNQQNPVT